MNGLRINAGLNWAMDVIDLHLFERHGDGKLTVCSSIEMTTVEAGTGIIPPYEPIHLSRAAAQELIDQLWAIGVRPTDGRESSAVVSAKDEHIKDLRLVLGAFIKERE